MMFSMIFSGYATTALADNSDNLGIRKLPFQRVELGAGPAPQDDDALVGNKRDEYGCIPSAGYSWCESRRKCHRSWEEHCPLPGERLGRGRGGNIVGGDRDENGCKPSAGYSWCESTEKCIRSWEEDCPLPGGDRDEHGGNRVGGDRDENGCIPSAGYSWCESTEKCIRSWEEDCPLGASLGERLGRGRQGNRVGGDRDENGCIPSAGYSWCESTEKCIRPWEEDCPLGENSGRQGNLGERLGRGRQGNRVGGDRDQNGCIPSAGYSWCESTWKCIRPWEEDCPLGENTGRQGNLGMGSAPSVNLWPLLGGSSKPKCDPKKVADGAGVATCFFACNGEKSHFHKESCLIGCYQQAGSEDCADCFKNVFQCAKDKCQQECTARQNCEKCVNTKCGQEFTQCSGLRLANMPTQLEPGPKVGLPAFGLEGEACYDGECATGLTCHTFPCGRGECNICQQRNGVDVGRAPGNY